MAKALLVRSLCVSIQCDVSVKCRNIMEKLEYDLLISTVFGNTIIDVAALEASLSLQHTGKGAPAFSALRRMKNT